MDLHWICLCPNPRISSEVLESTVSSNILESPESTFPPELPESWLRPNWPNWIVARIGSCDVPESPNQKIDKLDVSPNPRIENSRLQDNSKYCLCSRSLSTILDIAWGRRFDAGLGCASGSRSSTGVVLGKPGPAHWLCSVWPGLDWARFGLGRRGGSAGEDPL